MVRVRLTSSVSVCESWIRNLLSDTKECTSLDPSFNDRRTFPESSEQSRVVSDARRFTFHSRCAVGEFRVDVYVQRESDQHRSIHFDLRRDDDADLVAFALSRRVWYVVTYFRALTLNYSVSIRIQTQTHASHLRTQVF